MNCLQLAMRKTAHSEKNGHVLKQITPQTNTSKILQQSAQNDISHATYTTKTGPF